MTSMFTTQFVSLLLLSYHLLLISTFTIVAFYEIVYAMWDILCGSLNYFYFKYYYVFM